MIFVRYDIKPQCLLSKSSVFASVIAGKEEANGSQLPWMCS
jgi:hypothetical protein